MSSRTIVSGSTIATRPLSSRAVTTQMQLLPDIGCARSACRTMKPASASGRVGGSSRLTDMRDAGARLEGDEAAQAVVDLVDVVHLLEHGRAGDIRRAADDHLADLALAMDLEELDRAFSQLSSVQLRLSTCMYQPQGSSADEPGDLLGLEVVVEAPAAEFAADAGLLVAAPGRFGERGLRAVDPDDAGAEAPPPRARPARRRPTSRRRRGRSGCRWRAGWPRPRRRRGATQTTGPKISSRQASLSSGTSVSTVGSRK